MRSTGARAGSAVGHGTHANRSPTMRVLIFTHGTRGDVQPFAALAKALEAAGHEALLAAPQSSAALAAEHGVPFAPLDDGPLRMLEDRQLLGDVGGAGGGRGRLREAGAMLNIIRRAKADMVRVLDDMAAAADLFVADVVVHGMGYPGHHIAEYLGVASVPAALQPFWVPTAAFPNPMLPVPVPRALNRASHRFNTLVLRSYAGTEDDWRGRRLGLPRRPGRHRVLRRPDGSAAPLLQAFSRHLVPAPADHPEWVHTTGHWFLPAPADWTPPERLTDFLAAGDPPVFAGFGSMPGSDPAGLGREVVAAVRSAGARAVLATGWGGLAEAAEGEDVLVVREVPHDWLFPRVSAVVHAGGAGVAGAALAAGRPQIVCPFHREQRFWAERVHAAGLGPEPLPAGRVTAAALAERIRRAAGNRETARRTADLVRSEEGAAAAVPLIEAEAARGRALGGA
ncbi:glycosyltransferase [Streptomonospora salina]|uniref:Sterol 3beta-glucosyltransferase n=2 Tax=Streptomonospora salina TaxID=104205 RepID=A0A841E8T4_9ACTN|nr:glycosyltransferase [Streptomonospora salina]MBB5996930.1 sterol 3beta-glucosyltransferase [Streptomonospora salina]